MKMIPMLIGELDREADRSRRTLEKVPEGKFDWKPHEKSMAFGYLTNMIATIPSWIAIAVNLDELDIKPTEGSKLQQMRLDTGPELVTALEKSLADARAALQGTTEEHLATSWRLLAAGVQVMDTPRHIVIADALNHWAHHRGQMTVYLRLMGAPVPALYGPSADDARFL
jgi:uncharacterized damage-inducible protein DinB